MIINVKKVICNHSNVSIISWSLKHIEDNKFNRIQIQKKSKIIDDWRQLNLEMIGELDENIIHSITPSNIKNVKEYYSINVKNNKMNL